MNQDDSVQKPTPASVDGNVATTSTNNINGKSVVDFTKDGFGLIIEATKCTNAMPSGTSRNLYSAYPAFSRTIQTHSEKILNVIHKVLRKQQIKGNIQRRDNDEKLELLLECNDVMLERVSSNLDILAGIRKQFADTIVVETEIKSTPEQHKLSNGSWNQNRKILTATRGQTAKLLTARNIVRPQINFKVPVDNSATNPFEPRLKYKPHSVKPLAILAEYAEDGSIEGYLHPYEFELNKFEPNAAQLENGTIEEPPKLDETAFEFIDTETKLNQLVTLLSGEKEIAVDVEHHSYRTFQGITCLLQISTRRKDFVIDTLALREELHRLNEVFADPKIIKVFHGADCDIEWLQRDLSLYVVNMFDTHQAAKQLNFARLSLAFLLKHFCQIDADKSLQLADWRMRPLPDELIKYARQDTHFLLYIYDSLRQELLRRANGQKNLLLNVYQLSKEVCKRRYIKPKITADSHLELYRKSKRLFDNRQLYAFRELFKWRDSIARNEDESTGYVLPNHMMLQIAENLPREMQGILACCNPIPPLVRQHLHVLHKFILKAREQPLVKIVLDEQATNRSAALLKDNENTRHLYCPHDNSVNTEFRDDLPTLLSSDNAESSDDQVISQKVKKPAISVFSESKVKAKKWAKIVGNIKFISPYSRYLAVLPLAEKQRAEEAKQEAEKNRKRKLCPDMVDVSSSDVLKISSKPQTSKDAVVPLKDVDKVNRNDEQPQAKRQRIDTDLHSIETKLGEIRNNIEKALLREPSKSSKKQKKNQKNQSSETSSEAQSAPEFDYSQVDFKKFQGGSQKTQPINEIKTKFHGKGKNNKANKQFNKLFAFSNKKK